MNIKCPKRVAFVAWLSIIYAVLSLIPKLLLLVDSEIYSNTKELVSAIGNNGLIEVPFNLQIAHSIVGSIVLGVSAFFMLKGNKWALYLFVAWVVGVLLLTMLVAGISTHFLAKSGVAVIFFIMLFSRKSLDYFASRSKIVNA